MAYITLGAFQMSVFNYDDAFCINNPILPGTPLTVWLIAVIFAALYALFFVIYELVKRKLAGKKLESSKNEDKNQADDIYK